MGREGQITTARIASNLAAVRRRIAAACLRAGRPADSVTLVAVTKGITAPMIQAAFAAGQRHFGENRVQEATDKGPLLADIRPYSTWHMIGHLQGNKAGRAARLFDVVQSVDSVALARSLDRHSRADRPLAVYLEVNVGGEAQKSGLAPGDAPAAVAAIRRLPSLSLAGLMTVAPAVPDPQLVRPVFGRLREIRDALGLAQLSMGMTDDFEVAIEEGATVVRIGRAIFQAP